MKQSGLSNRWIASVANYPKRVSQTYADIGGILAGYGFDRVQVSIYLTDKDDLANLFAAIMALKRLAVVSGIGYL
ncbi:hypothetical protein L2A60_13055 [Acidiphilium iwatense]|uniref:Uncharacterized protein n=1 Tax=Acidiphilium iwatense TaxID=768198 RepID=A0ABS9E105_9PROT|nr:hypothetical protein [Acidiphilium iwatense]